MSTVYTLDIFSMSDTVAAFLPEKSSGLSIENSTGNSLRSSPMVRLAVKTIDLRASLSTNYKLAHMCHSLSTP